MLSFLLNNPEYNTAKDIVEYKGMSKSLVCRSVELLINKKYIKATPNPKDKRLQNLEFCGDGLKIADELCKARKNFSDIVTQGFSSEELQLMDSMINRMMQNIENNKREGIR